MEVSGVLLQHLITAFNYSARVTELIGRVWFLLGSYELEDHENFGFGQVMQVK